MVREQATGPAGSSQVQMRLSIVAIFCASVGLSMPTAEARAVVCDGTLHEVQAPHYNIDESLIDAQAVFGKIDASGSNNAWAVGERVVGSSDHPLNIRAGISARWDGEVWTKYPFE